MTTPRNMPSYLPAHSECGERRTVSLGVPRQHEFEAERANALAKIQERRMPGLAKTLPTARELREADEREQAALFDRCVRASGLPTRELARRAATHHSRIDDARKGKRNVTCSMIRALPPAIQLMWLNEFGVGIPSIDREFRDVDDADLDEESGLHRRSA